MPFHQPDSIRYFTFSSFEEAGVKHAIFTRKGGVSPEPWKGLNVGGTVGDDPQRVAENRKRAFQALERQIDSLYDVWQVHSAEVASTDSPRPLNVPHLKADAILTDRQEVTLFMRFADCVPILLVDPSRKVAGVAHAGWQGTVKRVAQAAVQAMQERYGCQVENILAGIGPSIGAHHYPIGPEVADQVRMVFGAEAEALLPPCNGAVQFDLWAANRLILEQAGIRKIEVASHCTACDLENWFSHRAEAGRTGRFGALIAC
jgi:YfiH family protein